MPTQSPPQQTPRWEIAQTDIVAGLRRLGIEPGDLVFFHTSYKSFGAPIESGPNGLIEATLRAVTPGGTIAVPTHSGPLGIPFDPAKAPMHDSMGAVPRVFLARADAVRSRHPTHSDAAIGPEAQWLVEGHEHAGAVGPGSPLDKIRRRREGKIVLYGVGFTSMTLIHLAEFAAQVPYFGKAYGKDAPQRALVVAADGAIIEVDMSARPGTSQAFGKAEETLRQAGLIRETTIGEARVWAIPAGPAVEALAPILRRDPLWLMPPRETSDYCRLAYDLAATASACDRPGTRRP